MKRLIPVKMVKKEKLVSSSMREKTSYLEKLQSQTTYDKLTLLAEL